MTYKKKLIEVALPLDAINRESAREKSIRHGHPSTLHLWWARRPLAAARAVLWASLVDDPSAHPERFPTNEAQEAERQRLFRILEELVRWENSNDQRVLEAARTEIRASCDGDLPNILDPFCGGGTIPLEAQRLGLPAFGGDLNPVAVLISKAITEVPPRFLGLPPVHQAEGDGEQRLKTWERGQGIAADIRFYGQSVRDRAFAQVGHLYPTLQATNSVDASQATVIAWIWARTVVSPDPSWGERVPLVRSWVLRKPGKGKPSVWIEPVVDRHGRKIEYRIREGGKPTHPTVRRGNGTCLATGATIPVEYIRKEAAAGRMGVELIGIAAEGERGRIYAPPSETPLPSPVPSWTPSQALPAEALGFRVQNYGLTEWKDLFTGRQLSALAAFSEALGQVRSEIEIDAKAAGLGGDLRPLREGGKGATAYADALTMYLAFAVDKLADLGNTLCGWEPIAQCPRHLFGRQTISMVWDFAEANPFSSSSGSWVVIIDGIVRAFESVAWPLPTVTPAASIEQRDAKARIAEVAAPVVSTDPPYYDNIGYADLSDFFYIWLRRNLRDVWPDELSTLLTPKQEELIANPHLHGLDSKRFFEVGMEEVFTEVRRAHHPSYPATVFYAFKQDELSDGGQASTGWETFLQGLLRSGLTVSATWPVRTETAGRLRAQGSNALASSIVIACRPRPTAVKLATRSEFLGALRSELPDAVRLLQHESIAPVDMAQSAIGPGMAVFSRYSKVVESDGTPMSVRQALVLINEVLQEALSEEETEFDSDTRWALTWFDQHGVKPGPYGDAETLSKAKNTSVKGVTQAGIAVQRDGKVRLLSRDELRHEWDPSVDSRLTVWEVTQHLISRLDDSESAAGELLSQIGVGMGERARQLAYLLYQLADRHGWSDEALAYNGLVQAWPDLSRLAGRPELPVQQTFGE